MLFALPTCVLPCVRTDAAFREVELNQDQGPVNVALVAPHPVYVVVYPLS